MTFKKFSRDDVFYNTVEAHPEVEFFVYGGKTYYNRESEVDGDFSNKVNHVPQGHISLHELNVNRPSGNLISAFMTKEGSRTAFKTVSSSDFSVLGFGDTTTLPYPYSASISRIYVPSGTEHQTINFQNQTPAVHANKKFITALENPINHSDDLSENFSYGTLGTSNANLVCVPSIFYGSKVQKGTVQLDFYVTGTLVGRLQDSDKNGELIQTYGTNTGKVAGIALYDYGIFVLTGSWNLHDSQDGYFNGASSNPTWLSFGTGIAEPGVASSKTAHSITTDSQYLVKFNGTNKIPTVTMMAHAEQGDLNFSHNPTFIENNNQLSASISQKRVYRESPGIIKNIKKSEYTGHDEEFESTTYISKIGIYDENKNLIAIATLANPVKKTELKEYTFKLRMDF